MPIPAFPVPLARIVLALMPRALLARLTQGACRQLQRRHPKLFRNLAALPAAFVLFEPSDLPHRFAVRLGQKPVSFFLMQDEAEKPDAKIRGALQALVDMLEGREDGDRLFFSRDIEVTGNTEVIVGLRNVLDREELSLYEEILSLCGPFAAPAAAAMGLADKVAGKIKERVVP